MVGVGGAGDGVGGIVLGGDRLHLRLGSGGCAGECSLELRPPAGRRPLACVSGGGALGGGGGGWGAGKRVALRPSVVLQLASVEGCPGGGGQR